MLTVYIPGLMGRQVAPVCPTVISPQRFAPGVGLGVSLLVLLQPKRDPGWWLFPRPSNPLGVDSQVQATVVGFLASIAAVVFGWIPDGHFNFDHAVLLCASSVATAFIASLVLGESPTPHTLRVPLPKMLGSPWPHPVFCLSFGCRYDHDWSHHWVQEDGDQPR